MKVLKDTPKWSRLFPKWFKTILRRMLVIKRMRRNTFPAEKPTNRIVAPALEDDKRVDAGPI